MNDAEEAKTPTVINDQIMTTPMGGEQPSKSALNLIKELEVMKKRRLKMIEAFESQVIKKEADMHSL